MRIPKLTQKDFDLLNLALDICESDYDPENANGSYDPGRAATCKAIRKLRDKLNRIYDATLRKARGES